jgi:hypothetical protein
MNTKIKLLRVKAESGLAVVASIAAPRPAPSSSKYLKFNSRLTENKPGLYHEDKRLDIV